MRSIKSTTQEGFTNPVWESESSSLEAYLDRIGLIPRLQYYFASDLGVMVGLQANGRFGDVHRTMRVDVTGDSDPIANRTVNDLLPFGRPRRSRAFLLPSISRVTSMIA